MLRLAPRIALALVLLALPASVARADSDVRPSGMVYSRPASADGSLRTFNGLVTPFGPSTGGLMLQFNPDGTFTGQFALQARGGTAYGTIEGHFTSGNTYEETLTFMGGTGKCAGISGHADVMGTMNLMNGTAIDTVVGSEISL